MIMRRHFYWKKSSMMRRKFHCEKEFHYEKEGLVCETCSIMRRKFY